MAPRSDRARAPRSARWLIMCLGFAALLAALRPAPASAGPAGQGVGPLPDPIDSCSSTSDLPPLDFEPLDPLGSDVQSGAPYYPPPPPAPVCIPALPPPPVWPTSPVGVDLVEPLPAAPEPLPPLDPPEPVPLPEPDPTPPPDEEPAPEPAGLGG